MIKIKFLDAGCGDAIHIRFYGSDSRYHNILIDGGVEQGDVYDKGLQREILDIISRREEIDLWIITHIDNDHIGGILRFIKDEELRKQIDLSKTLFWYNYSNKDFDIGIKANDLKSVRQGITLRNYLRENALLTEFITSDLERINFYGAAISVVSPSNKNLKALIDKWHNKEVQIVRKEPSSKKGGKKNDYNVKIDEFDLNVQELDNSEENGSSIALIVTYAGSNFLFLSDSHPVTVALKLVEMGYGEGANKLQVKIMQIAHHGSKFNTNDKLLRLIDCSNFVITADGFNKDNLPNKKTLVRVLKNNPGSKINFYITQKNSLTSSIFSIDADKEQFRFEFPKEGSNGLEFNLPFNG